MNSGSAVLAPSVSANHGGSVNPAWILFLSDCRFYANESRRIRAEQAAGTAIYPTNRL